MKTDKISLLAALATGLGLGLATTANAAIVYIDASTANTTLANGDPYAPTAYSTTTSQTDNQWSLRDFSNNGTVYTARDGNGTQFEDAPALRTRVTGLAEGTYDVYVYFWAAGTASNAIWDIRAGTTAAPLTNYNKDNASNLNDGVGAAYTDDGTVFNNALFTSSVMVEEGNRDLLQASIGTIVVDGSGNLDVFIDDWTGNIYRSWYDGIGYELVPEPTSLALLGLGGLLVASRRRRD